MLRYTTECYRGVTPLYRKRNKENSFPPTLYNTNIY
nr:MAG TPA: hypothetical protein [Caudoviricetes sp.]